jgi:cytochrome P450
MDLAGDARADQLLGEVLTSPDGRRNPYPRYAEIRERAPQFRSALGFAVLSRYEDCLAVLRSPHLGRGGPPEDRARASSAEGAEDRPGAGRAQGPGADGPQDGTTGRDGRPGLGSPSERMSGRVTTMLFANPPEHTRLRRLATAAFTPQRVAALQPGVATLVGRLLGEVPTGEPFELMSTLALPLPVGVIGELLGVPASERAGLQPMVRDIAAVLEPFPSPDALAAAQRSRTVLEEYFATLLAERRARPGDDLLSAFACRSTAATAESLSDAEVVATALLLFAAGFETTSNLIGNGLVALVEHPDQLERWAKDPEVGRSAVEELLRFDSPTQINARVALDLRAGDAVLTLVGSANRDPSRFSLPDELDLGRTDNVPLSFGFGIHHCLGASLARLEALEFFGALLGRFAHVELAAPPERRETISLRGFSRLDVVLDAA